RVRRRNPCLRPTPAGHRVETCAICWCAAPVTWQCRSRWLRSFSSPSFILACGQGGEDQQSYRLVTTPPHHEFESSMTATAVRPLAELSRLFCFRKSAPLACGSGAEATEKRAQQVAHHPRWASGATEPSDSEPAARRCDG